MPWQAYQPLRLLLRTLPEANSFEAMRGIDEVKDGSMLPPLHSEQFSVSTCDKKCVVSENYTQRLSEGSTVTIKVDKMVATVETKTLIVI